MKTTGGIILYKNNGALEVLLVRHGIPRAKTSIKESWGIPKGEINPGEEVLNGAIRECTEETGIKPIPPFLSLGYVKSTKKIVHVWASKVNIEKAPLAPEIKNEKRIEGENISFQEIEELRFFTIAEARKKITRFQKPLLSRIQQLVHPSDLGEIITKILEEKKHNNKAVS